MLLLLLGLVLVRVFILRLELLLIVVVLVFLVRLDVHGLLVVLALAQVLTVAHSTHNDEGNLLY